MPDTYLRRYAPATERNRAPILQVLRAHLPTQAQVLEIGSGTGEHAVFMAQASPGWTWQPTEVDAQALASIQSWIEHPGLSNVKPPRVLDVHASDWGVTPGLDAIVCCNVIHYSPWSSTPALLDGAARLLKAGGVLYLYGPYMRHGVHTSASNEAFDAWLKQRDPAFGVRNLETVEQEAVQRGLHLHEVIPMPANNLSVIFHNVQRKPV